MTGGGRNARDQCRNEGGGGGGADEKISRLTTSLKCHMHAPRNVFKVGEGL